MKKSKKTWIWVIVLAAIAAVAVTQTSLGDTLLSKLSIGGKNLGTEVLCYSAGRSDTTEDVYALRLSVVSGSVVSGEIALIPYQKDIKAGEFRGDVIGQDEKTGLWKADLIWTALGEGMVAEEQLLIQFNRDAALIGFGAMEQNENGRYVYADPESVVYSVAVPASSCTGAIEE